MSEAKKAKTARPSSEEAPAPRAESQKNQPKGLNRQRVIAEAAALVDAIGFDKLTLSALAQRLGVAVPSLYKHIAGLDALLGEVALLAVRELSERMRAAAVGRARGDAVRALAGAYRAYVREHPGRYAATVRAPQEGESLLSERRQAADEALRVVFAVLQGYGLERERLVDAARALRSAIHGFALIESSGGFGMPRDLDRSFDSMIAALDAALQAGWPAD